MQIQLTTGNHIEGSAGLARHVEAVVEDTLGRFGHRVTRVEVHLTDENSGKGGDDDKRCAMEARLAGIQPIAVKDQAGSVAQAIDGAAAKLLKAVDRVLDRKFDPKRRGAAIGGELPPLD